MCKIANDIEGVMDSGINSGTILTLMRQGMKTEHAGALDSVLYGLARAAGAGCTLSSDYCICSCSQMTKLALFGNQIARPHVSSLP